MSPLGTAGAGRRVAVFLPNLRCGGAEKNGVRLANGLAACGYRVSLVLVEGEGELAALVDPQVERVQLLPSRSMAGPAGWPPVRAARALGALIAWLRRERPAVVLPRMDYASFLALMAVRLVRPAPRVLPCISGNLLARRQHARTPRLRLRYAIHAALYRLLLPQADKVIAVSRGIAGDLTGRFGVPADRLAVIPLAPVLDEPFRRARARLPSHPWCRDRSTPLVVAVGRLSEEKDYPTLLEALARARRRSALRLVVLGEGPLRGALEALAARLGIAAAVDLVGFERHPESYLAHADVYVLCSRFEARPTALIEALACGTRVIATRCPHGPEEILEDGRFGRLVPVGDVGALASALVACLDEPPNLAARAQVERRHTREAHAAAYAALIAATAAAPAGSLSPTGERPAASGAAE